MKKKFTMLIAALALLTMTFQPLRMLGQMRGTEVTYDFSQISGFDSWGTSYSQHIVEYDDATVTFASANHQSSTITDIPVTKGQPVSLVLNNTEDYQITEVTFVCRQWGTKAQTITLHYSTDGGNTYTSTDITSTNFTITSSSLAGGTNAVKITFSSTSNQVGIESCTYTFESTGGGTSTPSINASNQSIAYDATSGSIPYTISNPTTGNSLSATCTESWVSNIQVTDTEVTFSTTENTENTARTATFTLTYTGATDKTVTVTQAGNPNVVNNISDITATNTNYAIRGTIVAKSARGLVFGDGTGYVYYYNQNYDQSAYNVGDIKKISGNIGSYNHVYQFTNSATIEAATTSNYNNTPVIQELNATSIADYNDGLHLSDYVQIEGVLVKSGNYYNLQITGLTTDASISYPTTDQAADLDALENKTVIVKGYFAGVSSGHFNVVMESIEEVVADPVLTVSVTALTGFTYTEGSGPSAAQSFTVAGDNLTENVTITAPANFVVCETENGTYAASVSLTPEATTGALATTTVYVKLAAGLSANTYSGNLTATSGTVSKSIALSGEVTAMQQVATPTFSPAAGTYTEAQNLTITCATDGATIHYTLDNTDPTANSPVYSTAIAISASTTVKAIAMKDGMADSEIASATYTIVTPAQETTYTLITNANALVVGEKYIIVAVSGENYKALGKQNSNNRAAFEVTIANNATTLTPASTANDDAVFELTLGQDSIGYWTLFDEVNNGYLYAAGTGSSNHLKTQNANNEKGQWTIEIDSEGVATIKAPSSGTTRNWIRYNNGSNIFSCYASGQLNVYLYKAGDIPTVETVATPTFSPAAGTYTEAQNVTITCATEGATIYYTLDGTTPTTASSVYSTPIAISQTTTVKAMAVKTGMTNSEIASAAYTINLPVPTVATPTFNPAAGTYTEAQNVTIACATEGATIYYTLDGTDPTTASSVYSTAIAISQTTTVKALAVKTGMTDSEITSASYTINTPTPGQETTYTLITSVSDLTVGDKYLIVALNGEEYDAMGKQNTGNRSGVSVTNSSNSITITPAATDSDSAPFEFTLGQEGEYWTLYDAVTGGYLYAASSSQNQLKTQATNDENGEWSIEFNTDGTAEVVAHGSNTRNYMRFNPNNGNPIFSSYASTSSVATRVSFYKAGGTPSVPTVATPTFTPIAGTYTEAQSVTIACATEGASIYYTLDGSTPTASSTLYTAPIAVATTTTIKAIATKEGYNNSAVATAEYEIEEGSVVIFNQTWENGMDGWSFVNVTGMAEWEIGDSNNNYYAGINAYQQGATEAWCISPAFSLDTRGNITLSFRTAKKYSGNDLQAFFSNDYDGTNPSTATWTELTFPLSTGNYEWVESGDISLNGFSGTNCYIGFKYTSTETQAASWRVDNIMLKNQTSTTFLTVMPSTLNGFYYVIDNGPSAAQSFAITGSNLTDDVTVTAPTNYEISETETGTYTTSLTLPLTNGAISSTVFVRLVAGLEVESYEGELTVVSDTLTATLALNGFVSLYPVPVLTATPNSVSGMTYAYSTGGPSNIVSFNLSAVDLHAQVHVYPSEHFEISTFGDTLFTPENPAVISAAAGSFTNIPIYVRLMDSLPGPSYNEQLTITTDGCDTLYVNVSGTVTGGPTPTPPTPPTPTPGNGDYARISSLSDLVDGSQVIIAARHDDVLNSYYAMPNTASGKPEGVLFTSTTSGSDEIIPASIADADTAYYWMVGVSGTNYTFTNADGVMIGYGSSGTDFVAGGDNTAWTVTAATSEANAMVPEYNGFNILNVSTNTRGFALNNQGKFGAYSTTNLNNGSYNFYLDFFVKGEGSTPTGPVVATPTFTPEAGTYTEAQMVTIACTTDSATIHFTLDGSTPTATSPQYTAPLTISTTTTIKAIAMRDGYDNSAVATATYTIQAGSTVIFNQDWEGDWNGWTEVNVEGDSLWRIGSYQGNHYALANGYNHPASTDWLISPAFDLNSIDNPVLTFRTAKNYTGPDLEVYFSNNYNGTTPATATWTALTCNLSQGSWNWVESGNISLSSFSGTNCYIGFKYVSDTTAAGWEVDDIMLVAQTTAPIVSVTPTTLTGFTYVVDNGPSTQQSFTIEGMNLTANVTVTAATDFEISTVMGTGFTAQNTITLVPVNGSIDTMIYVRLKAGLAEGTYTNENIVVASTGAATVNVVCSGQVMGNQPPVPPTGDYVRISSVSDLANGNKVILASRYNTTANAYLAVANTLTGGKLSTAEFNSAMSGTNEVVPSTLNEDDYYWTVNVTGSNYTFTNAAGQTISYNSSTNFNFTGDKTDWTIATGVSDSASLVPNYTGFTITNVATNNRAFALRVTETASVVGAYSTSNMNNAEYNFYLDIFRQGEGGGTPTVAAPTFTPVGGTYNGPQSVTINCATTGATIYYSTISATGEWTEYDGPITVDENMTIWAYAELDDYNDSPVVSATYVINDAQNIIFNQDWEDDWNGWTQVSVEGDAVWTIASYQGNHYAYVNGYSSGEAHLNEDWLISPAFDLDSYTDVVLSFRTAKNYTGDDLVVYFSNDYDGQNLSTATWQTITCALSQGSWNWVESGAISMDGFSGSNCHIAYKYTSTDEQAAGWEVDDILLTSGNAGIPSITATPNALADFEYELGQGPSESQTYILTSANLEGQGTVTVSVSENFEISLDNAAFNSSLTLQYADGVITNQPLTVYVRMAAGLETGTYTGTITHTGGGASATVNLTGIVHSENEPYISAVMPLYIQGNNGSNNNRVPVATEVLVYNLVPNTTYRFTNQFVDENDGPETAGAGNVIYADVAGFYRSTNPSLATEGGYGVFTTDADGNAVVWCVNEPTANARFTPGNHVYLRIRINDGNEGTTVNQTFTTEDYATVLNFGNGRDSYEGTAFVAKSNEAPMGFAVMYASSSDNRPIYATSIETTGIDYADINQYANFYKDQVAGNDGWFGGILPNDNTTGINHIWMVDLSGNAYTYYMTENGFWQPEGNTVNPNGGLDTPIFIDLTYDGVNETEEANVSVWSTGNEFVIENGDDSHYIMTVYNLLGQPMMQRQINAGSNERISHSLASGIYIINLENNHNKVATKVLVR